MTQKGPKDSPRIKCMKKHTCVSCNFGSDDLSNFNRHNKTARHLAKCAMVQTTAAEPTTERPTTKRPTAEPATTPVQTAEPATMVPEPQTIAALVNLAADLSCQLNAIIELIKVQMHGPIAVQVHVAVPYDTEEGRVIKHLKDLRSAIAALNQVPEPVLEPVEEVPEPEEVAEPVEEVLEPVEEVPEPEEDAEPVSEPEEDAEPVSEPEEDADYGRDEEGRPYKYEPMSFEDTCDLILEQFDFKTDKKEGTISIKTVDVDVLWSLLPEKHTDSFASSGQFEARASRILGKWKSAPRFRDHEEILETTIEQYDTVERLEDDVKGPPMVRCKCCKDVINTYMVTFHTCTEDVEDEPEDEQEEQDDYVDTYGQYGFDKWGKPLPPPEEEDEPAHYGLDEQGRPYKHQPKSFDDTCSLILEQYGFKADKKKGVESIKTVNSDVLWSLLPSKYRSLYWRTIEDPPHANPTELKEWQAMSPQEKFEARASRILGKWKGSGPQFRDHKEILETTLERYDTVEQYNDEVNGPPMVRCRCCRDIFNTYMVTFHTCAK